jgi:hypothetical protein
LAAGVPGVASSLAEEARLMIAVTIVYVQPWDERIRRVETEIDETKVESWSELGASTMVQMRDGTTLQLDGFPFREGRRSP